MVVKMKIGNVELENNVFLAPMAGVTDIVFRIISFVKNVKTELDFTFILSCASASYADSFFLSFLFLYRFLIFPCILDRFRL